MPAPQRSGQGQPFPFPAPQTMICVVCLHERWVEYSDDPEQRASPREHRVLRAYTSASAAVTVQHGQAVCLIHVDLDHQ